MKRSHSSRGFTIVEVMLFLAITGLMMAGVLAAINGTVNRQRYEDAVTSLTDYFQGQYNLVDNVRSNRPSGVACTADGFDLSADTQPRGTSDCSIIGRFIRTTNGREFISRPVYATHDIKTIPENEDRTEVELLEELQLRIAPSGELVEDDDEYRVAWNTYAYTNADDSNRSMTVVVLRSPSSGLMRTYLGDSSSIMDVVRGTSSDTEPMFVCVATDNLVNSPALGAKLLPLAGNVSSVQPITGGESRDGGC